MFQNRVVFLYVVLFMVVVSSLLSLECICLLRVFLQRSASKDAVLGLTAVLGLVWVTEALLLLPVAEPWLEVLRLMGVEAKTGCAEVGLVGSESSMSLNQINVENEDFGVK